MEANMSWDFTEEKVMCDCILASLSSYILCVYYMCHGIHSHDVSQT